MESKNELIKDALKDELKNLIKEIKRGKVLKGKELALILKKITTRELKPGGPYLDFKLEKPDLKLNILISEFLKTQKVVLTSLEKFIENKISKNNDSILKIDKKNKWQENLIRSNSNLQTNSLNTKKTTKSRQKINITEQREKLAHQEENAEIKKIFKLAKDELKNLPKEFREEIIKVIKETAKNNPDKQMLLLPYYFYRSLNTEKVQKLNQKLAQKLNQEELENTNKSQKDSSSSRAPKDSNKDKKIKQLITKLGLINAYFWSAFIIYDDFWDEDEKAKPKLLPIANFMSRNLIEFYFSEFQKYKNYQKYYQELLNSSDYANFFETINCRFKNNLETKLNLEKINLINYKDYKIKFFPAGAHILGPLLIMAKLSFKANSKEIKNLENFFINYLIARQLNDDIYDFKEDLARGSLSPAVNETFIQAKSQNYKQASKDDLKKIFWLKTLKILSEEIIKKNKLAESYLKKIKIIKNSEPLLKFCYLAKESALKALKERRETLDFIKEIGN